MSLHKGSLLFCATEYSIIFLFMVAVKCSIGCILTQFYSILFLRYKISLTIPLLPDVLFGTQYQIYNHQLQGFNIYLINYQGICFNCPVV